MSGQAPSAAIYGMSGPELTGAEHEFFRDAAPWGFILFARNIDTPAQVRRLTTDLRECVGRNAPILIDQEGGRVQRMRAPHWKEWQPVRDLGDENDDEMSVLTALRVRYAEIAHELLDVGVDVNCVPLLDVPQRNAHPIIGDRALGWTATEIAVRGREAMAGLIENGVLPVIKHLPGHGRALHDSHLELPRVSASLEELRKVDFPPFLSMRDAPLGMTAHVVYEAIDPDNCATLSASVLEMIRTELGFDGLLMTDDLGMKALSGAMSERGAKALQAGCDVVLHCSGEMDEMQELAPAVPALSGAALARAERAEAARKPMKPAGREPMAEAFHG